MGIKEKLTVAHYGLSGGKLLLSGTTASTLVARLMLHFYNEDKDLIDSEWVDVPLTQGEKTAIIGHVTDKLQELESATGWTKYEPPSGV